MDLKNVRTRLNQILGNPQGVQPAEVVALRDDVHRAHEGDDAAPSTGVEHDDSPPAATNTADNSAEMAAKKAE